MSTKCFFAFVLTFKTICVHNMFWACSFHVLIWLINEQYFVILRVNCYKNKIFWQRFTCIFLLIWQFRRSFSRYSVCEWYKGLKEIPWDHRSITLFNATLRRFWDHCDILIRNEPRAGARDFAPRWNPKCAGKLARAFAKAHHKVFH